VGAILALGVLVAAPLILESVTRYWAYPGSMSHTIYRAARDLADPAVDEALRKDNSPDARYALGARALWSGRPEEALGHLLAAVQGGLGDPELFTLLGNVYAQLGRRDKAVEAYQQAVDVDGGYVIALFNMSRVLFEMGEYQRGNAAYRRSTAVDLEAAERYARQAKTTGRGYVVPAGIARRLLDLPIGEDPAHKRAVDRLWANLARGTPRLHFAAAALVAVILIALMAFIRRPITYPELIDVQTPPNLRDGAAAVEVRIQTEIATHRYQASIARLAGFFGLLVAGGGQLTRGATLSGMLLMLPFVTAVTALLGMAGLLPVPAASPTGLTTFHAAVAGVIAGGAYLVALWDGARES
jgi:tetratricopeptide (TPR) repeat protein